MAVFIHATYLLRGRQGERSHERVGREKVPDTLYDTFIYFLPKEWYTSL